MSNKPQTFFEHFRAYRRDNQNWSELNEQVVERLRKPWGHPEFIFYFFIVVCIIGLGGVIISFSSGMSNINCFDHKNFTLNICTTFIAVVATAAADLVMTGDDAKTKIFRIIGISSLLVCIGLFWLTTTLIDGWNYVPSCFGLFLALSTWWLANANSPHLTRQRSPSDAVPDVPDDLPGNTDDFDLI